MGMWHQKNMLIYRMAQEHKLLFIMHKSCFFGMAMAMAIAQRSSCTAQINGLDCHLSPSRSSLFFSIGRFFSVSHFVFTLKVAFHQWQIRPDKILLEMCIFSFWLNVENSCSGSLLSLHPQRQQLRMNANLFWFFAISLGRNGWTTKMKLNRRIGKWHCKYCV